MSCGRNRKGDSFDSDKRHYTRILKRNIAYLIIFTFFGVDPNFTLNYPGALKQGVRTNSNENLQK